MEILSPKENLRLEKKARKTQAKINRILKKKMKGWIYDGMDSEGNVVFKKSVWILKK